MRAWIWIAPLAVAAALAAAFAGWTLTRTVDRAPADLTGTALPEVVLPILADGVAGPGQVDLKTAGVGRPMLLNVFASWCGPCRVEHPRLLELKAQGVAVVGVALRDAPADTAAWLAEMGDPYAMVLVDADGEAARALGVDGPPATFAVDARGRIARVHVGVLNDPRDIDLMVAAMQAPPRLPPTATRRSAAR